jgi:hypothetical protein
MTNIQIFHDNAMNRSYFKSTSPENTIFKLKMALLLREMADSRTEVGNI